MIKCSNKWTCSNWERLVLLISSGKPMAYIQQIESLPTLGSAVRGRVGECTDWSVTVNRVYISFLRKAKNKWATVRVTLGFFLESQQPQWRGQPLDAQRNANRSWVKKANDCVTRLYVGKYRTVRQELKGDRSEIWKKERISIWPRVCGVLLPTWESFWQEPSGTCFRFKSLISSSDWSLNG